MILTDYYKFAHLPNSAQTRIDCICSTGGYPDFERMRDKQGKLFVYFGDVPLHFGGNVHKKADKCLSKNANISSIYYPDLTIKTLGFGDVKGTLDALLIINDETYTEFEILIARGQKNNRMNVWQNLAAGELDIELDILRKTAIPENNDFLISKL